MQTLGLLGLNFARFRKGWSGFLLIILVFYTLVTYHLERVKSEGMGNNLTKPVPPPPRLMGYRISAIKEEAQLLGNLSSYQSLEFLTKVVNVTSKDAFLSQDHTLELEALNGTSGILWSDVFFELLSNRPSNISYSLTSSSGFGSDLAQLKLAVDSILTKSPIIIFGRTGNPSLNETDQLDELDKLYSNAILYSDFYILIVCSILLGWLMEEKRSGMKFYLRMTGVKSSSYYMGTLLLPLLLSFVYAILIIALHATFLPLVAIGPTAVLVLSTSFAYLAFTWVLAHFINSAPLGYSLISFYVLLGYFSSGLTDEIARSSDLTINRWIILTVGSLVPRLNMSMYFSSFKVKHLEVDLGFSNSLVIVEKSQGYIIWPSGY
jgi:hypothetical protein